MKLNLKKLTISQLLVMTSFAIMIPLTIIVIIYISISSLNSSNKQYEIQSIANSKSVIEKIDRNFYERFGDVQAFASNVLAVKTATSDTVSSEAQDFINTMTRYYVLYDLMMIVDIKGKVVATNTIDKNGKFLNNQSILNQNFSNEIWFRNCVGTNGPEGGAWFSDFKIDKVSAYLNSNQGFGMAFSAPIKNKKGETIGVWYNFANWSEVTQGIRRETEEELRKNIPNSFILITNNRGEIIDAEDNNFLINRNLLQNDFTYNQKEIKKDDFIIGKSEGKGAYTYKGKNWIVYTFIPKASFTWDYFVNELSLLIFIILIIITVICLLFYLLSRKISSNINSINNIIGLLSKGKVLKIEPEKYGEMGPTLKDLIDGLESKSIFANQIGLGNLDHSYIPLSDEDILGNSLISMRDNLIKMTDLESKRNWINEGLAKFSEILRQTDNIEMFYSNVLSNIIRYINANQGYLYVLNDNENDSFMEIKAVYAYGKQRYLEEKHKIYFKEGLVGQAWFDKEPLYFTEIPSDYVRITSGMGEATPRCIFIMPLIVNEIVVGAIEFASFFEFKQHEKEFISKISESIAGAIQNVKTNQRTRELLELSQQQTEEMRSQEEEMRQNLEEMNATQAEMARKEREMNKLVNSMKQKEIELQQIIDELQRKKD